MSPLDLHVLSTPPAFVLSQDQTLSFNPLSLTGFIRPSSTHSELLSLFAFLFLYRFQGSVPIRGSAARVSLCILSNLSAFVNDFWELSFDFLQGFWISELYRPSAASDSPSSERSACRQPSMSATFSPFGKPLSQRNRPPERKNGTPFLRKPRQIIIFSRSPRRTAPPGDPDPRWRSRSSAPCPHPCSSR